AVHLLRSSYNVRTLRELHGDLGYVLCEHHAVAPGHRNEIRVGVCVAVRLGPLAEREVDLDLHRDRVVADIAAKAPHALDLSGEADILVPFHTLDLHHAVGVVEHGGYRAR